LLLPVTAAWSTRLRWLPAIGTSLNVSGPLSYAPAVLILPGSEETRSIVAADLMRGRYADFAVVIETQSHTDVHGGVEFTPAETTRQILIRRGVPHSAIVTLPGDSDSTLGDARALDRYFQQHDIADVIIVTNAYHTRRAQWTFQQTLPKSQHRLRFYAAPNGFDDRTWWTTRKGRQSVLSEWLKFAYYLIRHGHGWVWIVVPTMLAGAIAFTRHLRKDSEDDPKCTSTQSR
jgi:uncharacterized SAM-binding protein YcdF (DUF218 family)